LERVRSLRRPLRCDRVWARCLRNRRGYPARKRLPRKAIPADIRSLCRAYTAESVRVLASIMRQPEHSDAARIAAANILLDRGWGRAAQAHTEAGDLSERAVTIRHQDERDAPAGVPQTVSDG
jgi:hypothetical protein